MGSIFRFLQNSQNKCKVVTLGDPGTGKTSIRHRYLKRAFRETEPMTIGLEFSNATITVDGEKMTMDIYDVAGQESFDIRQKIMKGVHGAIIVFDLTRHETFFSIRSWIDEVSEHNPKAKIPVIIVGNKLDLRKDRVIHDDDIKAMVESLNSERSGNSMMVSYSTTSAKTGENVDRVFQELANKIGKQLF